MKKKFEKNYRSVDLLMAVFLTPLYATDEIPEELYEKCIDFDYWVNKRFPGFLASNADKFSNFLIKMGFRRAIYTFRIKQSYQACLNYVYDNFTMNELKLIYKVYVEENGGHASHVNFIFNRL
ncbi:MAG: hypothetical protein PUI24_06545 [Spirochaetales bacterium]|nr:hypothetical protein [Spirochaetales bacterium]MDY2924491.1 hypothetical protein [Treponema sp.]